MNSEMGTANQKPYLVRATAPLSGVRDGDPVLGVRQRVYLLPGQLYASAEPCQITTILGSCVSVCLFDRTRLAGGMNHFLLPSSRKGEPESMRFGDTATVALLEKLMGLGCRLENITAKIFGGSALFRGKEHYPASLGAKNVAAAIQLMENAGIQIVAQETGGDHGRKVVFDTDDGAAWSRRV
jgi:chemotaxis protein CheD